MGVAASSQSVVRAVDGSLVEASSGQRMSLQVRHLHFELKRNGHWHGTSPSGATAQVKACIHIPAEGAGW